MKMAVLTSRAALGLALVIGLTPTSALAKKKHHGGSSKPAAGADSGGGMTFEPDTVERKGDSGSAPAAPAETPAPAAEAPKPEPVKPATKSGGKKSRPNPPAATVAPGEITKAGPPSKTLERALKIYESGDYPSSTIELNKVVEGQSGDDAGNKQRAEFFMGKALFNMKYYSASLSYFDRIVQAGPTHRYYAKTLQWLAQLTKFLPESAGTLEKIGKYTRADLEQPSLEGRKDELYYLLGRYHYTKGDFDEAIALFQSVPETSENFPAAKFMQGLTYVRGNKGREASESFKDILRKVKSYKDPDKMPKALREYEELANLSLGRIFYTTHQYDQSIKYYEKIAGPDSRHGASIEWLPSLFEASWAYFQKDGDSKALGNIHSINSPFFETEFYPESYILKAVIYFNRCNYEQSAESINEFNAVYPDLKRDLDGILSKYSDNAEFYKYILKVKSGEAGLSTRLQHAVEGALYDRTLQKTLDYVTELDRELKAVDKSDPAWKSTAVAGNIVQDLTLQQSLAANEAGDLARKRLQGLSEEIRDLMKQSIKIEFETLGAMKHGVSGGLVGEQTTINPNAKSYNTIQVDDEHVSWPFKGEYWRDELGYYRFKVANKCGGNTGK